MKAAAIIVAGGASLRFGGDIPKQFREVCGRPLLSWAVSRFQAAESIDNIILVVTPEYLQYAGEHVVDPYGYTKVTKIVEGGATRQESVLNGLKALPISTGHVAIHDGARVLTRPGDIDAVVGLAMRERAAIIAEKATDTIKRARDDYILSTLDRDSLYRAQTPQVFQYDLIMEVHQKVAGLPPDKLAAITDDASLVETQGFKVKILEPSARNLKVTTEEDLKLVEALLQTEKEG